MSGGAWSELTTKPYDSDAHGYRDPVWSNSGGGAGLVSGRATALAADGGTLYAGTADGGVWKRSTAGGSWTPLLDDAPTLSIGAVEVNRADHSVWVGTGEANTSSDSYAGTGVLRSPDGGGTWARVGGTELDNHLVGRLVFDGAGHVFAATSEGLYRRSTGDLTSPWTAVLKPANCPQAGGTPETRYVSDVAVRPGTGGRDVVAVIGWRAGSVCNGFYVSHDGGGTFTRISVTGSISDGDIGRTTLAYSADGSKLYAVVQSVRLFNHPSTDFGGTILMGVFVSPTGDPAGSWNTIAEWRKLANSGSALKLSLGYHPGVQAWYNQFLTVDPADANHVYLGLEEVFETTDGGTSWNAVGPYWNFGLRCASDGLDNCPPTTHPDQHAVAVVGGTVYVGNDGGIYSRALRNATGWANLNKGLGTLQYYYAAAGHVNADANHPATGDAVWGGLQDNGVSLLSPGASTMVSPFGGDGGDNIVDPTNGDRAVNEYVGLDMALTTNGGRSDGTTPAYREISPACGAFTYTPSPCDPNPRFIAPFRADAANPSHWVAGGRYVWDNLGKGWSTTCGASSCDWKIQYDTGAGNSITAIGVNGVSYVGWCGPCNGSTFQRGIATTYGGFGHVFETTDGGATWTDVSGNLPDAPGDDLLLVGGRLVLATDIRRLHRRRRPGREHHLVAPWHRVAERLRQRPGAELGRGLHHRRDARAGPVDDPGTIATQATGAGLFPQPP